LGIKERNIKQRVSEMEEDQMILIRNSDINPEGISTAFRKIHNHREYF
jgi:hypothetical protein